MKREGDLTSLHLLRVTAAPAVGTIAAKVALRRLLCNGRFFWVCVRIDTLNWLRCLSDSAMTVDREADSRIGRQVIEVGRCSQ